MDPFKLLKHDHEKVKDLFAKFQGTKGEKTRERLFAEIRQELELHSQLEEQVLYPVLKEHQETKAISLEGEQEHHVVKVLLNELSELPVQDEAFTAKLTVLQENVEHHIKEEEGEMFKQARQVLDKETLAQLGDELTARKEAVGAAGR